MRLIDELRSKRDKSNKKSNNGLYVRDGNRSVGTYTLFDNM